MFYVVGDLREAAKKSSENYFLQVSEVCLCFQER